MLLKSLKSLSLALVITLCASFTFTPSALAAGSPQAQSISIDSLTQELQREASKYNATVSNVEIKQTSRTVGARTGTQFGAQGATSCTMTATVSIPGGTGITISVTADTCEEAASMLASAIARAYAVIAP
ncbi:MULTISPECIES: hypothetical protein [unclassified Lysobacter]